MKVNFNPVDAAYINRVNEIIEIISNLDVNDRASVLAATAIILTTQRQAHDEGWYGATKAVESEDFKVHGDLAHYRNLERIGIMRQTEP